MCSVPVPTTVLEAAYGCEASDCAFASLLTSIEYEPAAAPTPAVADTLSGSLLLAVAAVQKSDLDSLSAMSRRLVV